WENSAWVSTGTTLYRYWLGVQSSSSSSSSASSGSSSSSASAGAGGPHLLKYVVGPAGYALLAANVPNPLTAADSIVATYADHYYEYDSANRVTRETVL